MYDIATHPQWKRVMFPAGSWMRGNLQELGGRKPPLTVTIWGGGAKRVRWTIKNFPYIPAYFRDGTETKDFWVPYSTVPGGSGDPRFQSYKHSSTVTVKTGTMVLARDLVLRLFETGTNDWSRAYDYGTPYLGRILVVQTNTARNLR